MATKEDILEQIVEEYLISKGYFVRHNLKFLPTKGHRDYIAREDVNHSDIDVLGFHPTKKGPDRIWAVSCKSWQSGFNAESWLTNIQQKKTVNGRPAWKHFRELCSEKWTEGFIKAVHNATGSNQFTHVVAVAKLTGASDAREKWEQHLPFKKAIRDNKLKVISFVEMVREMEQGLSRTLAGSEVGRLLQMFAVAGIRAAPFA